MHKHGLITFQILEMKWTEDEEEASKSLGQRNLLYWPFLQIYFWTALKSYINLQKHENLGPKWPKNKFNNVKNVSEYILLNWNKFSVAEVHNNLEGTAFFELYSISRLDMKIIVFSFFCSKI